MLTSAMLVLLMITPVFGFFKPIPALLIGLPAGVFCFYMQHSRRPWQHGALFTGVFGLGQWERDWMR